MRLSVLVVNWNVRDLLRECLRSLFEDEAVSGGDAEILVVDNASSDGSGEMVREEFPAVTLIANTANIGFGAANNQGFRQSSGEFILLINPDTIVRPGAVAAMLSAIRRQPRTGILGCRVLNQDGSYQLHSSGSIPTLSGVTTHFLFLDRILPRFLRSASFYSDREPDEGVVGWVSGACMLIRRQAIEEKLFDERYFLYCEDLDLCARVAEAGWVVSVTRKAEIVHYDGRSFASAGSDVQLEKTRNLRRFFFERHGRLQRIAFDVLVAAGFLLRAAILAIAVRIRRTRATIERRNRTLSYLRDALVSLRSAGAR